MGPVILLILIAVGMTAGHAWDVRRIRAWFAAQGATVLHIRWLPLVPLRSLTFRQLTSIYGVHYRDRHGTRWACRFVCGWWDGFHPLEPQRIDPVPDAEQEARGMLIDLPVFVAAIATAIAGCFAIGATYWPPPLSSLNLPNGLYGPGLVGLGLAAAGLTKWRPRAWLLIAGILALAPVATISVRVARDLAVAPDSHNLLGIEIIIGLIVGAVVAGGGALMARSLNRPHPARQQPPPAQ